MKNKIILRDYQEEAVKAGVGCVEKYDNNSLLVLPVGCHDKGYPIQMFDGTLKVVEEVEKGDCVMGNDGTSRTVLELHKGKERFYKITTTAGESFSVNENHVLYLERSSKYSHKIKSYLAVRCVSVKEYLTWAKSRRHEYKLVKSGYESTGTAPIPYLLGLWLGDGSSNGGAITNIDIEIIEYMRAFSLENNVNFTKVPSGKYLYSITSKTEIPRRKKYYNVFFDTLKKFKLIKNKHIPEIYFSSSREVRLLLLAGIIDTDGSYDKEKNIYDFGLSSEKLFDDCVRLCRSLGLRAIKRSRLDCNGNICWRMCISGKGQEDIPCLVSRKKGIPRRQKKNALRFGFSVEEEGVKDFYGFELDGNHLYIDGQGFIQHNSGKSIIVAEIARRIGKEILILQPSKEILAQNMAKLSHYVDEGEIGVYSASFGRKDIKKYNFATIQSIYKKPELFEHIGLCVVDECDLVNPRNSKGMFTSFLGAIGSPPTIGLTATPFRNVVGYTRVAGVLTTGTSLKLVNRMNPRIWNRIAFNINHEDLVASGYLSPIKYIDRSTISHNRIPLNRSKSDFDLKAFETMLEPEEKHIVESINAASKHKKSVLVFCSSVEQAERMASTIKGAESVSGKTPTKERDRIIEGFKDHKIDIVFNVGVLTVGFDHPSLDCIYVLRPTRSLRLYIQMLGRGTRLSEGKENCLVIDYSGNFRNLGKLENVTLEKEGKLWELYANGIPMHNRELFSWSLDKKK